MTDLDLCYLSATEAVRRFKTKKLSPVELVRALVERAERVESKVNAFTYTFYDRAIDQAKKAEAKYMRTDGRTRPLEGLAIVIKDETTIKGERTTFGSLVFKDNVDTVTAPPAELIFKAGAIMLARSCAPEFSCAPPGGSGTMPSMRPNFSRSGAVSFNAFAACSALPASR